MKSDQPPECMTCTYSKEADTVYDYYRCNSCAINWVCEACSNSCHKDCDKSVHMLQHRPTYACCYCVKKNKCQIRNHKNM